MIVCIFRNFSSITVLMGLHRLLYYCHYSCIDLSAGGYRDIIIII